MRIARKAVALVLLLLLASAVAAQGSYNKPTVVAAEFSPDNRFLIVELFTVQRNRDAPKRYHTFFIDVKTGKQGKAIPGSDFRAGRPLLAISPDSTQILSVESAKKAKNPRLELLVL